MDEEGEKLYTQWCQLLSEKKKEQNEWTQPHSNAQIIHLVCSFFYRQYYIVLYTVVLFTPQWAANKLKTTWAKYLEKLRTFNHY